MTAHWNGGSGGKGSSPRPYSVSQEEYANRWDAIFQRDIKEEKKERNDESSSDNSDNRKSSTE